MTLRHRLSQHVDASSVAVFRVLFGALMVFAMVRTIASGHISTMFGDTDMVLSYWAASWVPVPSVGWIYALYIVLALCALGIALGLLYRASAWLFFVGFTFAQLLDVTYYLNHYYLVSLLSLLCALLPMASTLSLDALRRPGTAAQTVPRWCLYLLRFQIAVVYGFAALAKFQPDWLLHAQPLNLWLSARDETAVIGPLLDEAWVAYAASWFGFLFDSTIVLFLWWRRSRRIAYVVLLGFHTMTGVLFNIGMFPYIMSVAATLWFAPDWPRRWLARRPPSIPRAPSRVLSRAGLAAIAVYCAVQVVVPLRHYAYPGDVLWNEQGMRWSWKVMVREKHGALTYYVNRVGETAQLSVSPTRYLSRHQEREMATQPDLILQLAHHIRDDFEARGYGRVEVRAEALVSLNGRPAAPMIDPNVNLAAVDDDLSVATWVLPAPDGPPPRIGSRR